MRPNGDACFSAIPSRLSLDERTVSLFRLRLRGRQVQSSSTVQSPKDRGKCPFRPDIPRVFMLVPSPCVGAAAAEYAKLARTIWPAPFESPARNRVKTCGRMPQREVGILRSRISVAPDIADTEGRLQWHYSGNRNWLNIDGWLARREPCDDAEWIGMGSPGDPIRCDAPVGRSRKNGVFSLPVRRGMPML